MRYSDIHRLPAHLGAPQRWPSSWRGVITVTFAGRSPEGTEPVMDDRRTQLLYRLRVTGALLRAAYYVVRLVELMH